MSALPLPADVQLKRIYQIAQDYRSKGYTVFVGPSQSEVPPFLRGLDPDLIALRSDDNAAVVVKRQPIRSGADSLIKMAGLIEQRPEWRLELVLLPADLEPEELLPGSTTRQHIDSLVQQARALGDSPFAIVAASAALENAAVLALQREGLDSPPYGSAALKTLFAYGILGYDTYMALDAAMKTRNDVVHGRAPGSNVAASVETIIRGVDEMLESPSRN